MNPYYLDWMVKERQREAAAEAELRRLVAIYDAQNSGPGDRLLLALGNTLIRLGENLKRRSAPPAEVGGKLCCGQ